MKNYIFIQVKINILRNKTVYPVPLPPSFSYFYHNSMMLISNKSDYTFLWSNVQKFEVNRP